MRFEYLRKDLVNKNNYWAFANIDMAEVIEDITDADLILELDSTGIVLNRFLPYSAEKDDTEIIVWIKLETEEINVQRAGFSKMHNEEFIEDIKSSMTRWDEIALIEYIHLNS